jgi:two-component system chemotaxis response regulator CheB
MKLKVLVVDDSALIRSIMKEIINSQPDMELVGVAPDPYVARELIKQLNPDVLTLDVEMPKMDGLDFLEKLMRLRPMPVLMVSSLTERESETTLRALNLGAVDFVTKPKFGIQSGMLEYSEMIADKIRLVASAKIERRRLPVGNSLKSEEESLTRIRNKLISNENIIAIGASTGGTEALRNFLTRMPMDCPGILIALHMPEGFTRSFARHLLALCAISVKEAEDGELVLPGVAYIAPGNCHLLLGRRGNHYVAKLDSSPPVNRQRPSVDLLFNSVAANAGKNATGIIMTGMGKDGALGLLEMKKAGAFNFAQDEASCTIYGMPKEAVALGAVHEIAPLDELPSRVLNYLITHGKPDPNQ